jgi:hypothetical protein
MSFNLGLWVSMGAAALFYHYAVHQKAPPALYVLPSIGISVGVMLLRGQDWASILVGQLILVCAILAYRKARK